MTDNIVTPGGAEYAKLSFDSDITPSEMMMILSNLDKIKVTEIFGEYCLYYFDHPKLENFSMTVYTDRLDIYIHKYPEIK